VVINSIPMALVLAATLWLALPSPGQQSGAEDTVLQRELQRLGVAAEALDRSLPSLTCQESAVSERLVRGKVKQHVAFVASMRAVRVPGGHLHETFTMTTLNGKPHSGGNTPFPFYTSGGFDAAMVYFMPAHQACYRYSLSQGRIDFETSPDFASHYQCRNDGVRGFALMDAAGNGTHMERTVPLEVAHDLHLVPFAAIDFAPVELKGQVYRLPQHMLSEYPEDDSTGRFETFYSGCRLFSVSVTIGPPTEVNPADPGSGGGSGPPNP
jgi:hypothetical protein